jgi:hypothetical protein
MYVLMALHLLAQMGLYLVSLALLLLLVKVLLLQLSLRQLAHPLQSWLFLRMLRIQLLLLLFVMMVHSQAA